MPNFIPFEFPKSNDGKYTAMLTDDRILLNRRTKLGLTQQEVADIAGVPIRQYQRLEAGDSDLSKTTAEITLSVCAALLLDPYEMTGIHVTQPDSSTLQPQDTFDANIPDIEFPKRAGRKPIRRDIMTVYFNHPFFSVMIPHEVLEKLGNPSFLELRWIKKDRRFFFCSTSENNPDAIDVPSRFYDNKSEFLAFPSTTLFDEAKRTLNWDDSVYAVECRLVRDMEGIPNILCELDTAQPSEPLHGSYCIPECMDEEDENFEEDDNE